MADFTPQQIEQFLQQFFDVVGTRQYTGARYVPIFGRAGEDTIEWDDRAPYEPLTVVMHQGVSYVSRRYVPSGIQVTDTDYWAMTYRFDAQVEQYRQQVLAFDGRITENAVAIRAESVARSQEIQAAMDQVEADYVPFPETERYGTTGQVLSTLGDGDTDWVDPVTVTAEMAGPIIDAWLDQHPEATTTVEDGSITTAKLADGAVTDAKLAQLGGILSSHVNDMETVTDNMPVRFTNGYMINTSGTSVNPEALTANDNFSYAIVPCVPGDTFTITGTGGSSYRLWTFCTSAYVKLTQGPASQVANRLAVTAPADAAYLVLNSEITATRSCVKGDLISHRMGELEYGLSLDDDDLTMIMNKRTAQMFDREAEYAHLLGRSTGIISLDDTTQVVFSYTIDNSEVAANTRYVLRDDGIDATNIVTIRVSECSQVPAVGVVPLQSVDSVADTDGLYAAITTQGANYLLVSIYTSLSQTADRIGYLRSVTSRLMLAPLATGYSLDYVPYHILGVNRENMNFDVARSNPWGGKSFVWLGTSIPQGSTAPGAPMPYPEQVGEWLDATVHNEALDGSMCRANVLTGDYVGGVYHNITRSLSQTLEEKRAMIANWANIWPVLYDGANHQTISAAEEATILGSSFEVRLLPYLDGTYPMPDLFVFDHGHNDYKYKTPDNQSDITVEPTVANITSTLLAEDAYMTANDNAKLVSLFGSLAKMPALADFVASVNRNCFLGAANFIVTLILHYNPHARIMFVSNYEDWMYTKLIEAQGMLAESWEYPYVRMCERAGFSQHYIPGTSDYWGDDRQYDLRVYGAYLKDETHPYSDPTGDATAVYVNNLVGFMSTHY